MRYITETRNLFDINKAKKFNGAPSFSKNGNQIKVSMRSAETWKSANVLLDTSLVGKTVTVTALAMTSGINKTNIRIQWVTNSGLARGSNIHTNTITGNSFQKITLTGVVPESPGGDFTNLCIMFYANADNYSLESGVTYSATFTNIQVELGSTATPYVPYGYLPMRRMKYKVSNVCQVLDKSKYPATNTNNGITFTNNVDGTITVNGTASDRAEYFLYGAYQFDLSVIKNHKYLLIITDIDHNFNVVFGGKASGLGYYEGRAKYIIVTASDTMDGKCYAIIRVEKEKTCNNEIAKPQLFDLTEMYGAGNEPTTVEEFRADFPDDLYEYTPYCWSSMKNIRYLDATKNLFDIPLTQGYPSNTNSDKSTKRTFTIGTYIVGLTRNNVYIPSNVISSNITKNSISFKNNNQSGYGVSVPFLLTVGKTYTVSCKADNNFYPAIGITYYKEDGTLISYTESEVITNNPVKSFTVPENTYYTLILFYGRKNNEYTFFDIQLDEGDTATNYVPYGYLPLK